MIVFILVLAVLYTVPGFYFARGHYSEQVRALNNAPSARIPPKPERPPYRLDEMLHVRGCEVIKKNIACNCKYRDDWVKLKNDWIDYDEWTYKWSRYEDKKPGPSIGSAMEIVPIWPLFLATRFVTGGAKNIPDYREIERMEREVLELK